MTFYFDILSIVDHLLNRAGVNSRFPLRRPLDLVTISSRSSS